MKDKGPDCELTGEQHLSSFTSRRATDHEYDAILVCMARENGAGEFFVPLPPDFGELIFATSRRSTHEQTLKSKQQSLDCCGYH